MGVGYRDGDGWGGGGGRQHPGTFENSHANVD